MSERITEERELFLYYYVFGTAQAKELLELWISDIMNTPHFQPQLDPNNTRTIRDMGVLEFIQGIKNRVVVVHTLYFCVLVESNGDCFLFTAAEHNNFHFLALLFPVESALPIGDKIHRLSVDF